MSSYGAMGGAQSHDAAPGRAAPRATRLVRTCALCTIFMAATICLFQALLATCTCS